MRASTAAWLRGSALGMWLAVRGMAIGQEPTPERASLAELQLECPIGEAIGLKYPEQVVLVTSVGTNGKPNIITLGWTMFCSGHPPMLAISVGKTRHSHALLMETREFVCAFPGTDLEKATLYCGTHTGREVDKFKETGLTPLKASKVKPPLIGECLANFECVVTNTVDAGDHTVFLGEIVAAWKSPASGEVRRLYNLGRRRFAGLP